MSDYTNEAGEPLMSHSQARLEADLDEQSAMDSYYSDRDDGPEPCDYDADEWAAIRRKREGLTLAILIPPVGDPLYVEIKDYQDLNKHAQCSVGTTVSHSKIQGCFAWIDDEGLLTGQEFNLRAGVIMGYPSVLAGPMVICNSNKEGDNTDVTKEIIQNVMESIGLKYDGECGYEDEDGKFCNFEFHPDSKFPFFVNGSYC